MSRAKLSKGKTVKRTFNLPLKLDKSIEKMARELKKSPSDLLRVTMEAEVSEYFGSVGRE